MTYGHRSCQTQTNADITPIDDLRGWSEADLSALEADRERWKQMARGKHLDDWLGYGPSLMRLRLVAMRMAHVNRPQGRGYVEALGQLLTQHFPGMDKASITALLWLHEDEERLTILQNIRGGMTESQRARFNSPISARQRVAGVLGAHDANRNHEQPRTSAVASLKQRIAQQEREIGELKAKLARQDDGSLFDLRNDSARAIADVVVGHVSESKAKAIIDAIRNAIKTKGQRPAG